MSEDKDIVEVVSELMVLNEGNEEMHDPRIDRANTLIVKIMHSPNIPYHKALLLITELQAISAYCADQAAVYATFKRDKAGTVNNHKKNIYYSKKEALDKLVDSLKYVVRYTAQSG